MTIVIPRTVTATTHETANLPGYAAIDYTGSLGEQVNMSDGGTLRDVHVTPWREGFGGLTFYFDDSSGGTYFVTHLDENDPPPEGRYGPGSRVGRLTTSAAHAALINGAHVHVGKTTWPAPGTPPTGTQGPSQRGKVPPKQRTVRVPRGVSGPTGGPTRLPAAFHELVHALGVTVPTRAKIANYASRHFIKAVR